MPKVLTAIFCFTILVCISETVSAQETNSHYKNHNDYKEWKTNQGLSCCNEHDCDIVKEWINEQGSLMVRWRGKDYFVPESSQLKDKKSPDGNSHACVFAGKVQCYVAGDQMF